MKIRLIIALALGLNATNTAAQLAVIEPAVKNLPIIEPNALLDRGKAPVLKKTASELLQNKVIQPLSGLPPTVVIDLQSEQRQLIDVEVENGWRAIKHEWLLVADDESLYKLQQLQVTFVSTQEYANLGLQLVRFTVPDNLDSKAKLVVALGLNNEALLDRNHVYQAQSSTQQSDISVRNNVKYAPFCANAAHVGIIDSAVNKEHPAFKGSNLINKSFLPEDLNSPTHHGSAVAGLLIGQAQGVIPLINNSVVYSAAVFYRQSEFSQGATLLAIVGALNWLANENVKVINMSFTGPDNPILSTAVAAVIKKNTIIVAAAGNDGPAALPAFPAAYNQVIAVSAIDSQQKIYRWSNKGEYIDYAALGVNVLTVNASGGVTTESGTSMAAPIVSAAIACLMIKYKYDINAVLSELNKQAIDFGPQGKDTQFGYGVIERPKS